MPYDPWNVLPLPTFTSRVILHAYISTVGLRIETLRGYDTLGERTITHQALLNLRLYSRPYLAYLEHDTVSLKLVVIVDREQTHQFQVQPSSATRTLRTVRVVRP